MIDNVQRPDPAEIARLIETDELIRYAVEELGGRVTAIRTLEHLERRKPPTWAPSSAVLSQISPRR
jgi:hypothetical protein